MSRLPVPVEQLIALAHQAGERILEIYETDFSVTEKADRSPLTAADMASHRLIVDTLRQLTPEIPVLSEESAHIPFSERRLWQRYWLIDPLDGTREFIKRNGEFTVNIALIEDHTPLLGVIQAPVTRVCYYGLANEGAWRCDADGTCHEIRVYTPAQRPLRIAGSRSHAGPRTQRFLSRLGPHRVLPMGSSLKSCMVAEGKADLYPRLGPTSEWDTAAAQAIVEAAGGAITDTRLQPLRYNSGDSLLNPHFLVFGDRAIDWSRFLDDDQP